VPAWALLVLEQVLPLLLSDLVKAGAINEAQKLSVEGLVATEEFLGKLKTYYALTDFPGAPTTPESVSNVDR